MSNKIRWMLIAIVIISLVLTSCGPGQAKIIHKYVDRSRVGGVDLTSYFVVYQWCEETTCNEPVTTGVSKEDYERYSIGDNYP